MSSALASPMPARDPRRSLMRFIVDRNPFFLFSAVLMFAGVRAILSALNVKPGDLKHLLLLISVLNVYEAAVIGLALHLVHRRGQLRDGWILLSIEALFLVDLTFLNAEFFTANLRFGMAINAVCWALAVAKVTVVVRSLKLRLTLSHRAYIALQLAMIFFMAGAFKQIAQRGVNDGTLSPLTLYGAWWIAGGMLALAAMILPRARDESSAMSPLPGRLYLFLPFISLLVHLAGANRVYWIHFQPANIAPILLGMAMLAGRRRGAPGRLTILAEQLILTSCAVALSAHWPVELLAQVGSHAISPLRLSLAGSSGVMVCTFILWHEVIAAQLGAAMMVAAMFGNSLSEMRANAFLLAKFIYHQSIRLVPETPMQWGVLAVVSSFVMLMLGAVVSLKKQPPASAEPRMDSV